MLLVLNKYSIAFDYKLGQDIAAATVGYLGAQIANGSQDE